jgi:hypothetical protein
VIERAKVAVILVDELRHYPGGPGWNTVWCHMATDDLTHEGLEELHAMARAIGLKREWFQDHPRHPHYDLPPHGRARALEAGAVAVTSRELVRRCTRQESNHKDKMDTQTKSY